MKIFIEMTLILDLTLLRPNQNKCLDKLFYNNMTIFTCLWWVIPIVSFSLILLINVSWKVHRRQVSASRNTNQKKIINWNEFCKVHLHSSSFCNQEVQCNQCRPDLPVSAAQKRQWRFWSLFRICMYSSQFLPFSVCL